MDKTLPKPWLITLNICLALFAGAWLPLRMVFYGQLLTIDFAVDILFILVLFLPRILGVGFYEKVKTNKAEEDSFFSLYLPITLNIMAGLPLVSILSWLSMGDAKYLFIFKLVILRKLPLIRSVLDKVDSLHPVFSRLLPLFFMMPTVVHILTCGWVWMGSGTAGPSDDHVFEYGRGVYWVITTLSTVGYGDIAAKTLPQMAFANITMIIGVAFFGYVLSNVASLISRLDAAREAHTAVLDKVEAFMKYNELPTGTKRKVRGYFRYLWESRRGYDDAAILSQLPKKLRSEVALFLNAGIIEKVSFLNGADQELLEDIVLQLIPQTFMPEEKIFHVGEPGDAMYFIHHGSVEIVSEQGKVLATLQPGSFFGEMALINSGPRNATAIAVSFCDIYVLKREAFEYAISKYPSFQEHVHEIAQTRSSGSGKKSA